MRFTSVRCSNLIEIINKQIHDSGKFSRIMEQVKIIYVDKGKCKVIFTVAKEHQNPRGTMHGGFAAALVDFITTYALMSTGKKLPGVSVDLHLRYLRPAMFGDQVIATAETIIVGKSIAHLSATLKNKHNGNLLISGMHTKLIV